MKLEMILALLVSVALLTYGLYCVATHRREQGPRAFVALAVGFLMLAVAVSDMAEGAADAPTAIAILHNAN